MTLKRSESLPESSDEVAPRRLLVNDEIAGRGNAAGNDGFYTQDSEPQSDQPSPEQPLSEQISELVENAKVLAETEIAYYRAKLDANVSAAKKVIALFSIGIAFGTAGLTALVLGALLTLSPLIGPGPATLVVALGFCALGGLMVLLSVRRARKLPLDSENL